MEIYRPTLVLNKEKCLKNIKKMSDKAKRHNLAFRPHFKTHQSRIVGDWLRDFGVEKITVSSARMAEYFSLDGWKDITIAFPVNLREIKLINDLSVKTRINLLISDSDVIEPLNKLLSGITDVYLEVDTGYNRTGVKVNHMEKSRELIRNSNKLLFQGFITHTGQTYHAASPEEILDDHRHALEDLKKLQEMFPEDLNISIGDTPACSLADDFGVASEIRPGNFIFFDWMQYKLGACSIEEIAVCAVCPVVATYPSRNEVVVYGGAIHLSKDSMVLPDGNTSYGALVDWSDKGWGNVWKDSYVSNLSQEHGIIKTTSSRVKQLKPGDLVGILPVHSCLTAESMRGYLSFDGNDIDHMARFY